MSYNLNKDPTNLQKNQYNQFKQTLKPLFNNCIIIKLFILKY